jgi:hypothetical protein
MKNQRHTIQLHIQITDGGGRMASTDKMDDMLRGMKAICTYMNMSEATVLKFRREYDDFPVKSNGVLYASKSKLSEWYQNWLNS